MMLQSTSKGTLMRSPFPASALAALLLLSTSVSFAADPPIAGEHAVIVEPGQSRLIFPVAGKVEGASGVVYQTEITLLNLRTSTQLYEVRWLDPHGVVDPAEELAVFSLGPYSFRSISDFVGQQLQRSGIGAVVVTAVTADGRRDEEAMIHGTARIWHRADFFSGTLSQTVPALLHGLRPDFPGYIHGLRQSEQFRSNLGIVNLDLENPRSFRLWVRGENGVRHSSEIHLAPGATRQMPVPAGPAGTISVVFEPLGAGGEWVAYGSSVDNVSGSAWTLPAISGPPIPLSIP
jgi:hypothetical protein